MELNEYQWQLVDSVAIELVKRQGELNPGDNRAGIRGEVEKIIAYLRHGEQKQQSFSLWDYLETLVRQGNTIGHSGKTLDYFKAIQEVFKQYLSGLEQNNTELLQILGWVKRMMRYYGDAVPIEEVRNLATALPEETLSQRQAEIQAKVSEEKLTCGQEVEARITAIRGNKVTYTFFDTIPLAQKEPKLYQTFKEGQKVTVIITELKDDGGIKKFKYKPT
jgi:hypothetical protein